MAKKKKTQLKSVARGFATVSVPKKAVLTEPEEEVPNPTIDGIETIEESILGQDKSVGEITIATESSNAMKVEEQSLQALMDRLQDKTEKEIAR